MIVALPIMQLIIMPLAADYEIKNIQVAWVDLDHSSFSRDLRNAVVGSGYFVLNEYGEDYQRSLSKMEDDAVDLVVEIPQGFERNLVREGNESVFVAINAINGTKANVGGGYLTRIVAEYNQQVMLETFPSQLVGFEKLEVTTASWFNAFLDYPHFMVPGILVILVTMVGSYMCALNIVKEKEVGTIEQINVTPVKKVYFLLGKLLPFWVIGNVVFTIALFGVARIIYGIVPVGSVGLLYGFLSVYLVAILGIGLLISTYSQTQQQAMSLAFFFVMIFILMGGLFTPIESMPEWAQVITRFNPVSYFIEVMRMVVMKGSSFADLQGHFFKILGFALFFNAWAIWNYRKTA
jgi:ABC-2 type transport system permease protein